MIGRDLGVLIDAARLEVEARMNEEAERVGGDIVTSRLWWELRGLQQTLDRAAHRVETIERLS